MDATQKQILRTLKDNDNIGAHHILADNLKHCLPRHDRGKFNKAIKELIRQRYIYEHTTGHGTSYAISPSQVAEIENILNL